MSLSLSTTSWSTSSEPAWLSASKASPALIAPSPITATARRALAPSFWRAAIAMPSAAEIDVLEWPTPKVSYSLSARDGNGASPPWCLIVCRRSRRPVRTLCG